jgi:oligopeptide transport system substrate-binding protein
MLKLVVPVLILIVALAATVLSDRPQPKADFTFINSGDVATLDLQKMSWMQDFRVARILFEGLVKNDTFTWDYAPRPGVAASWDISDDGLTYTFHLRRDARWSNGAPVTAGDFVYAWRRAILPDVGSDYFKLFQLVDGAQEFYEWRTAALKNFRKGQDDAAELWRETERTFTKLVGMRAIDDRTLEIRLVRPTPYFLDVCAFAVAYPVYPPLVRQYEKVDPRTGELKIESGWTKPPLLVSNGPFKLVQWRFKRDMRLERNEHYWNPGAIAIDSINIPSVEDPNAAVLAFTSGGVDWVSDVTPPYRGDILADKQAFYAEHAAEVAALRAQGLDQLEIDRRLPDDPRAHIHAIPAFGTYFYNFNCQPTLQDGRDNPFHDPRVRRAFAMAIDKKRIADEVRRLGEPVAGCLTPPGSIGGYESPKGVPFDPPAARALLAQAGFPDPSAFITVEILFNKDAGHDLIAQAIAKDWQEYLGVPVALVQREIKVFRNDLKKQNYMVSRAGWYGDYGDPTTFLELSRSTDGNNDRKYANPEYDALLDRASAERDPAARLRILEEAERMIVERDLPMVPIFHYSNIQLFDAHRLSGISTHPRQEQNMYLVDLLDDDKGPNRALALPPRVRGSGRDLGGAQRSTGESGEAPPAPAGGGS